MASKKRKKRRPRRAPSRTPHVPKPPTSDDFVRSKYEITNEPIGDRRIKKLPEQVQERLDDLYELAQSHPRRAIPELEQLVADYPHIPTLAVSTPPLYYDL